MPVPWGGPGAEIPDIACRAITVRQLRDLTLLLQRLCEVQLLTRKNWKTKETEVINFFDINMYDIRDVLRAAILYHSGRQCSWVEFVTRRTSQPPRLLFSQ